MAQQPHAVRQLRLDLHADDAQQALRLQDRLSELCRRELTVILDEELTRHCPPDVRLRLSRLELDLGSVPEHRLEAELPDLLRRQLRAALRRHLPPPPAEKAQAEADTQAVVPALEHFLLHGSLPWQINAAQFSLAAALQQALTQHPADFLLVLRRYGHLDYLRRRLAQELSPAQMLRLIALLEPVHAPFIRDYLLTTLATHRRRPVAPMTETSLRRVVYELVLTDLLVRHSTVFNRRAFVESQLRRLAAHHSVGFETLLRRLVDATAAPLPFAAQSALPAILRTIYHETLGAESGNGRVENPELAAAEAATAPSAASAAVVLSESRRAVELVAAREASALSSAAPTAISGTTEPLLWPPASGTAASQSALALARRHAAPPESIATAQPAGKPRPTSMAATTDELRYFLRHGSLPTAADITLGQLQQALAQLLARAGWPAVRSLLQGAGARRAAATLARHWPESALHELLRQAVAGHLRPFLTIMREAGTAAGFGHVVVDGPTSPGTAAGLARGSARQPAGAGSSGHPVALPSRQQLWEYTLHYVAATPAAAISGQSFSYWLQQQLPSHATAPAAPPDAAVPDLAQAREIVLYFLQHGHAPAWLGTALPTARVARLVQWLARTDSAFLSTWLAAHVARPEVRRQLVRLADFTILTSLLPAAARQLAGASTGRVVLEQLLPARTADGPTALRQFLLAAYLTFAAAPGRTGPAAFQAEMRRLAASYQLPWRATLRWLTGRVLLRPELSQVPFLRYLAAMAARFPIELGNGPNQATAPPVEPAAIANPPAGHLFGPEFPATLLSAAVLPPVRRRLAGAISPFAASAGDALPPAEAAGRQPTLQDLVQAATVVSHSIVADLPAVVLWPPTGSSLIAGLFAETGLNRAAAGFSSGSLASTHPPRRGRSSQLRPPSRPQDVTAAGATPQSVAKTQILAAATSAARTGHAKPNPALSGVLSIVTPAAGAAALVLHWLLHGRLPAWWRAGSMARPRLRQLLQLAVRRHRYRRTIQGFMRQHGASPAVQQRLAAIADFGLLTGLLPARGRSRHAAAALKQWDGAGADDAFTRFVRAAYVAFHFQPAGRTAPQRLAQVRQLAATYRLPWRALLTKLDRLLRHRPLLLTEPLFAALWKVHELAQQQPPNRPAGRTALIPGRALPGVAPSLPGRTTAPATASKTHPQPSGAGFSTSQSAPQASVFYPHIDRPASPPGVGAEPSAASAALPTGEAARDLVFHYLLHQQLPWWAAEVSLPQLRRLLAQVVHHYRPTLRNFVREHLAQHPALAATLARLASFSLLTQLLPAPAQLGRHAPAQWNAARLDTLLAVEFQASEAPVQLFLKETYLAFTLVTGTNKLLTDARQRATRYGLSWRAVLRRVRRLHQHLPALATVPFFAWLLVEPVTAAPRRPGRRPAPRLTPTPAPASPVGSAAVLSAWHALEQYLHTGQQPTSPTLAEAWPLLLRPEARGQLLRLRPLLAAPLVRERLLSTLPPEQFLVLLRLLFPAHYRVLAPILADWQVLVRQGVVRLGAPALFEVLLALVQATPAASFRAETVLQALLTAEEQQWPANRPGPAADAATRILRDAARRGLVLRGPLPALLTVRQPPPPTAARPPDTPGTPYLVAEEPVPLEMVYVANAGLVLLWPFLNMLFGRLGYLNGPQFRDADAAARAAILLQFLVTGDEQAPEFALPLNKLLCGIQQPRPLLREPPLTEEEKSTGESLLRAAIARWEILKSTSITGLRETFLMRQGKLEWLEEDRITLTVEPRPFDMLLDQRPWSISIIKLPWMPLPLYVTWR